MLHAVQNKTVSPLTIHPIQMGAACSPLLGFSRERFRVLIAKMRKGIPPIISLACPVLRELCLLMVVAVLKATS